MCDADPDCHCDTDDSTPFADALASAVTDAIRDAYIHAQSYIDRHARGYTDPHADDDPTVDTAY